jgi:methyl-accepting chemotaxis protein
MHEMSINVQNVVKNTQVQASSVAETSASIDQMVTSIQRVADTAKVLLDIAHRSREEVVTGIGTMEKATDGLNRTNRAIQSSAEIINILGHRADDIGKIIEVIDDLAEQTNLLALNAAIEAARAGEHGLGFAVVADEVRKLAEHSRSATKDIAALIKAIQAETNEAVVVMEEGTKEVESGATLADQAGRALDAISSVVRQSAELVQEISLASKQQVRGTEGVAHAMQIISNITRQTSQGTRGTVATVSQLVKLSDQLNEALAQFRAQSKANAAAMEEPRQPVPAGALR